MPKMEYNERRSNSFPELCWNQHHCTIHNFWWWKHKSVLIDLETRLQNVLNDILHASNKAKVIVVWSWVVCNKSCCFVWSQVLFLYNSTSLYCFNKLMYTYSSRFQWGTSVYISKILNHYFNIVMRIDCVILNQTELTMTYHKGKDISN